MKGLAAEVVDAALVQQVMGELGIRVPLRGWVVKRGRLVLLLATGERVVWEERKGKERGLPGRKGGQDGHAPEQGGQDARAPEQGGQDAHASEEER